MLKVFHHHRNQKGRISSSLVALLLLGMVLISAIAMHIMNQRNNNTKISIAMADADWLQQVANNYKLDWGISPSKIILGDTLKNPYGQPFISLLPGQNFADFRYELNGDSSFAFCARCLDNDTTMLWVTPYEIVRFSGLDNAPILQLTMNKVAKFWIILSLYQKDWGYFPATAAPGDTLLDPSGNQYKPLPENFFVKGSFFYERADSSFYIFSVRIPLHEKGQSLEIIVSPKGFNDPQECIS
ncbi:hypothetical protein KKF32_04435 [Patescibacteria group bacterium]|nr:hypothetical protein [Patescibacteria group bacterium]